MKITKEDLQQIIKEELENILLEKEEVSGTGMNEQQSTADASSAPSDGAPVGPGTEGFTERGPRNYKEAEYDVMNALKKIDHFKIQKLSRDLSKLARVILSAADPEAYSTISIRKKGHFLENSDIKEVIAMLSTGADGLDKVEKLILQARGQRDPYARFR